MKQFTELNGFQKSLAVLIMLVISALAMIVYKIVVMPDPNDLATKYDVQGVQENIDRHYSIQEQRTTQINREDEQRHEEQMAQLKILKEREAALRQKIDRIEQRVR